MSYAAAGIISGSQDVSPLQLLSSQDIGDKKLGAQMVSLYVSIYLEERFPELKAKAEAVLKDAKELAGLLKEVLKKDCDYIFIRALSDLWVADLPESICLTGEPVDDWIRYLIQLQDASGKYVEDIWNMDLSEKQLYDSIGTADLMYLLGALPLSPSLSFDYIGNVFTSANIRGQLNTYDLWEFVERVSATAVVCYACRNKKMFMDLWESELKDFVKSSKCSKRGRNLYHLQSEVMKENGW